MSELLPVVFGIMCVCVIVALTMSVMFVRFLTQELHKFDDLADKYGGRREHAYDDIRDMLQALRELKAPEAYQGKLSRATLDDLHGGDIDPGFGVDPEDSGRLLELREAIEHYLGWANERSQEAGDYVARVREVGDALTGVRRILP